MSDAASVIYAVVDPATGEQIKTYPTATDEEVTAALEAAESAYLSWGRTSALEDRVAVIKRVAQLHRDRRDELAKIIVREMGKPEEEALGEVDFAAEIYDYYADHAAEFLADEKIDVEEGSAVIVRQPFGVLVGIMPWNFPYYQVARFAGPNILIGNTILLKHAPQCPESAAAIQAMFDEAQAPKGVYNNIYATNEQIADLIADSRVQGVSLTGSERAGAQVAAQAGKYLKKCVLELGGSDPFILLSTDDLKATVGAAVQARLENGGQVCNGGKRFIVAEDLYDDFLTEFTAQLKAAPPAVLSSEAAAERLQKQVDEATAAGAKLETSGQRDGAHFPPGVLTGMDPDGDSFHQEFFGPVAMVVKAKDEADAVRLANDTPFGLGSYLYTTDSEQAQRVAAQIEAGMVFVNVVGADAADLPFGGVKRSGFGRELGRFGMEEFVNKKLIRIA
ncbi:NAD-dependent succinate-semialdehyde dehydrogenase [Flexivirga meconopsidis]|uniref:NAD-dependent succinate-semialdehyde dehydrogenase n=1 Tax=Flexivirga meconopsidis TaxID=2977121 RepID=UPI00223EDB29|nr:NAD-dependent succinate-semialdehyde dehydrogenase [Flexivirga meconopsidis]